MIQKISVIILAISVAFSSCAQQTTPTGVPMKKITKKGTTIAHDTSTTPATTTDKSSKTGTSSTTPGTQTTLSTNEQIANGLKEALKIGATNSANKLSITDAFFKNNIIKILMPPEVKDVESKMRALGFGSMVDDAILRMNRAAELAAKDAGPIFLDAITHMSFSDAASILTGANDAATQYLKGTTSVPLTDKFKPVIKSALDKTEATKYWGDVFTQYNKIPFVKKVNPDLTGYVTGKALDGLFYTLAGEEAQIRKDPMGTANSIIETVFGKKK